MTEPKNTEPLALFGGTFDPIHTGHLRVCLEAGEALHASQVSLLPCASPAHREQPMASAEQRLAMLDLALAGQDYLVSDRRELDRPGTTYTIDTLHAIRAEVGPDRPLILMIGADQLAQLDRWKSWQRLLDVANLAILTRPNCAATPLHIDAFLKPHRAKRSELARHPAGFVTAISVTALAISASDIRRRLSHHLSVRYLLPDAVIDYLQIHGLYSPNKTALFNAVQNLLR
jgi:nicotinate-nucleotide adenylyltransferase